jgi:hypothetical protein
MDRKRGISKITDFLPLCIYHQNEKGKSPKKGFTLLKKWYHTFFEGLISTVL